ncbi:MAG: cyclase [Betaproteobacteria bacterium]|nr:cyclase [Betaproteobacteria bacterium]
MIMSERWNHRPDGSTWGDFGPDDQLGRLNLITREKVLEGIAEVKEGLSFCLSLPLNYPGGSNLNARRHPPEISPCEQNGFLAMNLPMRNLKPGATHVVCDDRVLLWTQYSTQWDSFAHCGNFFDADGDGKPEIVYYNGYRANEHVRGPFDYTVEPPRPLPGPYGAFALGVENMAAKAIQGRAVLVDLHAHFGRERVPVGYDELQRVLDKDRVEVGPGDMLLVHTGMGGAIMEMRGKPEVDVLLGGFSGLNGQDARLLQWITDSRIAAICSDNQAVEAYTTRPPSLPLHLHCLFKLGVPLGELWWLGDLARWLRQNGRSRVLLTAPPLRLPGAVGSPVTPVATV